MHIFQKKIPTPFLLSISRLQITTPELLDQFRQCRIGANADAIQILSTANATYTDIRHPCIQDSRYSFVNFTFGYGEFANFAPATRQVEARFTNGNNHFVNLPNNYVKYDVNVVGDATITPTDIDAILDWSAVEDIRVIDSANFAYDLSQRVNESKAKRIERLVLVVQPESYDKLSAEVFLNKWPDVNVAIFQQSDNLASWQFEEFCRRQSTTETFRKVTAIKGVLKFKNIVGL